MSPLQRGGEGMMKREELAQLKPEHVRLLADVLRDQYRWRGSLDQSDETDIKMAGHVAAWAYWFGEAQDIGVLS